jgi:hypothetical protein
VPHNETMVQSTESIIRARNSLLIVLLCLVLAIGLLAVVSVQTVALLPNEKTSVALLLLTGFSF